MAEITEVPPPGKRKSPTREFLETIILALIVALVVRTFVVEVYRVDGSSMENTLRTEERVLVNKFIYRFRNPEPGDVIVFKYPKQPDRDFIKRVVAVAGDTVQMEKGKVYVNGQPFPEPPTVRMTTTDYGPYTVPAGSVFVLGDNRNNSEDSRFFGQVPLGNIRGLAFARIWPPGRISVLVNPAASPGR
ncbi:MAG: signal peptidase I [Bacillota bacterium]